MRKFTEDRNLEKEATIGCKNITEVCKEQYKEMVEMVERVVQSSAIGVVDTDVMIE